VNYFRKIPHDETRVTPMLLIAFSCFILADGSSAFRPLRGRLDASLSGELRSTADQFDHLPRDGRGRHQKSHRNVSFLREI